MRNNIYLITVLIVIVIIYLSFFRKETFIVKGLVQDRVNPLVANTNFDINVPKGVVSQIITVLNIEHLIFNSDAALEITFDLDFSLVSNQIKSCSFYNFSSDYQLKALYSSKSIEKLTFTNVKGEILPKDLSLASALKSLEFRLCSLNSLPVLNKNKSKLENKL